jgi:outer membrane protein TolC
MSAGRSGIRCPDFPQDGLKHRGARAKLDCVYAIQPAGGRPVGPRSQRSARRSPPSEATQADFENVRLAIHAELAVDYLQLRALDAQKQLLESAVAAYEESLNLARARYETGIASDQDVAQAQRQLTTTRAEASDLGVQRAQLEHSIAVMVGHSLSNFSIAPSKYE